MTYRFVPQSWQRGLQLATLIATILVGFVTLLIPADDPRLDAFVRSYLEGDFFGWALIVFGTIGLSAELKMGFNRGDESLVGLVAWCHIILAGAMFGYSLAAVAGVIATANLQSAGGPVLGLLVAAYHAAYVRRRPRPYKVDRMPAGTEGS